MRLKKVGTIQKRTVNGRIPKEEKDINSKENVEKIEDPKEEVKEVVENEIPVMQINYDELPEGVYDFSGLTELQKRLI